MVLRVDVDGVAGALHRAFQTVDNRFLEKFRLHKDGTTAVVMVTIGQELFLAWVGDSRAVLGSRRKLIFDPMSSDDSGSVRIATPREMSNDPVMNHQPPGWKSSSLTTDHKPDRPDEQRRITSAGGIIVRVAGVARVAKPDFEVLGPSSCLGSICSGGVSATSPSELLIWTVQ